MFLLSFIADTWPTDFLVSEEIFSAFEISDDVFALFLEGFGTGSNSHFDIGHTFNSQSFSALIVTETKILLHCLEILLDTLVDSLNILFLRVKKSNKGNNCYCNTCKCFHHCLCVRVDLL